MSNKILAWIDLGLITFGIAKYLDKKLISYLKNS
jgi:hypothetical protein